MEKGRNKGGEKEGQVTRKGVLKSRNPLSRSTQGFPSGDLPLAHCCRKKTVSQTCCSGFAIKVGVFLLSGRQRWKVGSFPCAHQMDRTNTLVPRSWCSFQAQNLS